MERSPAASTAVAIADAVKSLVEPTLEQDCFSSAVCTDGNPYGIRDGLICSMPCWSEVSHHAEPMALTPIRPLEPLHLHVVNFRYSWDVQTLVPSLTEAGGNVY